MRADQLLEVFDLRFDPDRHVALMGACFVVQGQNRSFTKAAQALGVVPFILDHPRRSQIRLHRHDFFELTLVVRGSAQYQIGSHQLRVEAGQLLLIGHRQFHGYQIGDEPCLIVNVCFDPGVLFPGVRVGSLDHFAHFRLLRPFFWESDARCQLPLDPTVFARLLALAAELVSRFQARAESDRIGALRAGFASLIHGLYLAHEERYPRSKREIDFVDQIHAVLVKERARDRLALPALAKRFGMNPFAFSRFFKKQLGLNLPAYINQLRIEGAKQLLRSSDLPVTEVALECGFEGLAHFHRTFKKMVGQTPRAFRQEPP